MFLKYRRPLFGLLYVVFFVPAISTDEYYAVTHPTYDGQVLNETFIGHLLIHSSGVYSTQLPLEPDRSMLDSKCSRKCLRLYGPNCKTFQSYWTTGFGHFVCRIFDVNLCTACTLARLVTADNKTLEARLWEVKGAKDPNPTVSCAEYPDWKVPGNCSECGRIGYYGRNCSLRSSCASYFYESGAVQDLNVVSETTIAPCFTQGQNISTLCRGPYTFWFRSSIYPFGWWTRTNLTRTRLVSQLPSEIDRARQLLGSIGRNLFILIGTPGTQPNPYIVYSNFSIGINGSLYLSDVIEGNCPDGFNVPVTNAPFLQPLDPTCGPMWLVPGTDYNSTHMDTCAANTSLFGITLKWAGQTSSLFTFFIDIDYFACD